MIVMGHAVDHINIVCSERDNGEKASLCRSLILPFRRVSLVAHSTAHADSPTNEERGELDRELHVDFASDVVVKLQQLDMFQNHNSLCCFISTFIVVCCH